MSEHRESYDDTPDGNFSLMPAGFYPVRVIAADVHPSKSSGADTWYLDLEVHGPKYAGKKLWLTVGMSDNAKGIRKGVLTALGLDTAGTAKLDLVDDVLNRKAVAEVYHEKGRDGVEREKVRRLRSAGGSADQGPAAQDEFSDGQVHGGEGDEIPF
jgi:hypothetical protein